MNRIVVIEDDPAILSGLEATLRSESYDVLAAADGEDGYTPPSACVSFFPNPVRLQLVFANPSRYQCMNRRDLVRYLKRYGCERLREGGNYSVM